MSLEDDIRSLAASPALCELEHEALRLIAFSSEMQVLRAGDLLFAEGEPSAGGFLLLSGAVALETVGSASVVVRPPTLIGETALIAETKRPCAARAIQSSSLMKISRKLFCRVLSEYPESARRLQVSRRTQLVALRDDLGRYKHEGEPRR
jgi:CRP-like cAMP-binding protein